MGWEAYADLEHVDDGDVFVPGLMAQQSDVRHTGSPVVDFHLQNRRVLSEGAQRRTKRHICVRARVGTGVVRDGEQNLFRACLTKGRS